MARIRNIKRNTSNQIISYSIPPNSDVEYGVVRLPAVETVYGIDSYNRTLDRLSGDLLQQVDNQQVDNAGNVFTDTFSGRYEITTSARTYNGTLDRQDITIFFDTIPWDNVVKGPTLEDGAYRITKELIDSGKNLRLKATVAISNDNQAETNRFTQVRFKRKRIPQLPESVFVFDENEVSPGQGTIHQIEYEITNSEMVENDLWEVQVKYGKNRTTEVEGIYMRGDQSLFEVELF